LFHTGEDEGGGAVLSVSNNGGWNEDIALTKKSGREEE
jgi:hypothetical protein